MTSLASPPKSFYRFFHENGLKTLVDGTLKLTPPREFNDPFEFYPGLPERTDFTAQEIEDHFTANGMARLVHQRGLSEQAYRTWVKNSAVSNPHLFPEHFENLLRTGYVNLVSLGYGVICFSTFKTDQELSESAMTMWAHYAANHCGLVIEFDGTQDIQHGWLRADNCFFEVSYDIERPRCSLADFASIDQAHVWRLFRHWGSIKSRSWRHENEWRFVHPLRPKNHNTNATPAQTLKYENSVQSLAAGERMLYLFKLWEKSDSSDEKNEKARIIRRVILGERASSDLFESVRSVLTSSHLQHVGLYKAKLNKHAYKLDLECIRSESSN